MSEAFATIAVYDRDLEFYDWICSCVQGEACELISLNSRAPLLPQLASLDIDLLIVEHTYKEGELEELLRYIKAELPSVPLILSVLEFDAFEVARLLSEGVVNILPRVRCDAQVLRQVLKRALFLRSQSQELADKRVSIVKLNRELKDKVAELERDQLAGRLVQRRFLPPSPVSLAGIDISHRVLPSHYLSGDSVDFGLIADRYLAFYLIDVSGHGSASAFVAVWIRQLVRGFLREQASFHSRQSFEEDIPLLLVRINEALVKASVGPHLTCFVAVLDTHSLELHYVVAGHLPLPILCTSTGAQRVEGRGKALGLFEGAQWQINRLNLPDTFSLAIFSDGILELLPGENLENKEHYLHARLEGVLPRDVAGLEARLPLTGIDPVPDDVAMLLLSKH